MGEEKPWWADDPEIARAHAPPQLHRRFSRPRL
jgi:hypothetical protein